MAQGSKFRVPGSGLRAMVEGASFSWVSDRGCGTGAWG